MAIRSQDVDEVLRRIRDDDELIARYDVTGDGQLDQREWELVRRMVELELRTAEERDSSWSLDVERHVLNDRFEVVGLLGRGGQAFTYLARDQQNDNKHVVVKELAIRVAEDWKSVELFEREAEVLERLTHPCIPRYIDAFHLEDDEKGVRFMLVQDFVDGEDLGHFVSRGGRWTHQEAAQRMAELCDILDYLHNKSPSVIHRDIKPSNIILGRDDKLYLVDFGAVQTVVPATVGGSTIIGTSGYVPMEQYMGHAEPASDVYALGATAVRMISGTHPSDLPFRRSRLHIREHLNVDVRLIAVLEQMLSPSTEDRPQSASDLAARLLSLATAAPPEPKPVPTQPSLPEPTRARHRTRRWPFRIFTDPPGAEVVYRSRKRPGVTPLVVLIQENQLPAQLTVVKDGFHSRYIEIGLESPTVIQLDLEPES